MSAQRLIATGAAVLVAALLGGCMQSPPNYQPVASGYFDAWAAQQAALRASIEQPPVYSPPAVEAVPRVHAGTQHAAPPVARDAGDCWGWWRICHFF